MENQTHDEVPHWAPVCEVCKTRDETLRAVSYPYVVSVIFMTFQRAFLGIYCKKHQRRYHLLASLITSTAGWLGIPYGFIMTPITLFKLARGGIVNTEGNIQLLTEIADKKIGEGDIPGAIRCLEECLKLQDDQKIRERLAKYYQLNRNPTTIDYLETGWQLVSIPALLLTSILVGLLIGLFDLLLAILLAPLFGENSSILIAILSWLPTVTMMFLGILIVRAMLRWALNKNKQISIPLGSVLAFASTSFAFYSVLEGQALIRNLQGFLTFLSISFQDGIFAIRSVLTHGGVDVLINNFRQGDPPSIISTILLIISTGVSLFIGMEMVVQTANGQRRLSQIRETFSMQSDGSSVFAWGMLSFLILGVIVFTMLISPGRYVNIEEAYQKMNQGLSELNQYHPDKAITHFEAALDSWPDSVTGHVHLGLGYSAQDKYDQSLEEFNKSVELDQNSNMARLLKGYGLMAQSRYIEAANEYETMIKKQPTWGLPHASLAVIYYILGKTEEADQEIQNAIIYENGDTQTISTIGAYYIYTLNFEKAEEYFLKSIKLADSPSDYIYLSQVYTSQGEFEQAEKAIENAEKLGTDPIDIYLAKIGLAEYQGDLDTAELLINDALKLSPNKSILFSERSFVEFRRGKIDAAASDAEKAIELNPYNPHAYVELANAYHVQGKLVDALEMAKKAIAVLPKYDRAHYILGLCYMDSGMKEDAIMEFETFLKLYWERPLSKELRKNAEDYLKQLKQ